ncbi:MAG: hypothetical protein K9K62_08650 [Desulfobacteraceae bacterium]|nr:hypothetical protein [Desulfobacteraceae bacterium]
MEEIDLNAETPFAVITFYIFFEGYPSEAEHGFHMYREDGIWKLGGNQWLVDIDIDPVAVYDQSSDAITENGLSVWVNDENNAAAAEGLDSIVVTGPGLPQEGIAPEQGEFSEWHRLYQESDGLDPAVIGLNAEYQVALYDAGSGQIAEYTVIVQKGPESDADLSKEVFAEITGPSQAELYNFTGGALSCTWIMPEGMRADDARLRWYTGGGWVEEDVDLSPGDTGTTLDMPEDTYPSAIRLEVEIEDEYGREFITVLRADEIEYAYHIGSNAYIQYRSGQDDFVVYLPATKNDQPISSEDISDVNLYNSADEEIPYLERIFWTGYFFLYDGRLDSPDIEGPVRENGYIAYGIDQLPPETYTAELVPYDGQSAQIEIAYPGRLDLPVVDRATMESGWDDAGNLELSWQNPAAGWGDVDNLRVVMYDHQRMQLAFVALDPSATGVTIPAALLSRFPELRNTSPAYWEVQAIAMDANGMSYARGASETMTVESAEGYSFGGTSYIQYRTHADSSLDGYRGFFQVQQNGAPINRDDITGMTVRDAQGNEMAIAGWDAWSASYNYMTASPYGEYGPYAQSAVYCQFSGDLPEGTYQVEIQTTDGDTLYTWIQASAHLSLPVVDSTTMASVWDAEGNLLLSWQNPPDGWQEVDQVRVVLYDRYGRELLYAVDDAGSAGLPQELTIPVDTINRVTSLYPRGPYPALWRVQTDARDTDEMVYARGFSNIQVFSYFIDLAFLQQITYEDGSSSWQAWMGMLSSNGIVSQDLSGFQVLDSNDNEVVPTQAGVWGSPVPYLFYDTTQEEPWLSGENWQMGYAAAFDFINHPESYRLSADLTEQGTLVAQVSVPENVGMPVIPASSVDVTDQTDFLLVEWTNPDADANWPSVSEIHVVFSAEIGGETQDVLFVGVPADAEFVEIPDSVEAEVLAVLADVGYPDVSNIYLRQIRTVAYNEDGMQYARGESEQIMNE